MDLINMRVKEIGREEGKEGDKKEQRKGDGIGLI